jgi:hypothetical protein
MENSSAVLVKFPSRPQSLIATAYYTVMRVWVLCAAFRAGFKDGIFGSEKKYAGSLNETG